MDYKHLLWFFLYQSQGFTLILSAIINVIRLSNTKPFKQKESNNVNVVGPWHLLYFVQKHVVLIAEMAFFTTQNIFENMLYVHIWSRSFLPWPQTICAWQWVQLCTDQKILVDIVLNTVLEDNIFGSFWYCLFDSFYSENGVPLLLSSSCWLFYISECKSALYLTRDDTSNDYGMHIWMKYSFSFGNCAIMIVI